MIWQLGNLQAALTVNGKGTCCFRRHLGPSYIINGKTEAWIVLTCSFSSSATGLWGLRVSLCGEKYSKLGLIHIELSQMTGLNKKM